MELYLKLLGHFQPLSSRSTATSKSDTYQSENEFVISASARPKCGRDISGASETKDRDGEIANGSHHLRARAAADTAAVFIEGDIANVMETVFDAPVTATDGQ